MYSFYSEYLTEEWASWNGETLEMFVSPTGREVQKKKKTYTEQDRDILRARSQWCCSCTGMATPTERPRALEWRKDFICFICLLFLGYTEHILFPPSFLCFSEAQILIVPTVIYQSGTLFFNRQKGGAYVCVLFLQRSDSRQRTGGDRRHRRKNNLTRIADPSPSHCPPFFVCFEFAFVNPLKRVRVSSACI